MRDPSDETEEFDTTYWQKTYEKQRPAQLRRKSNFKLCVCAQLISRLASKVTNVLRTKSLMVPRYCEVTGLSLAVRLTYCVSDILKADTSPSYTVPTRRSVSPQVKTILSARYTSIPLVALPSAPPATRATSKGSGLDVPQVPTAASPAAKP